MHAVIAFRRGSLLPARGGTLYVDCSSLPAKGSGEAAYQLLFLVRKATATGAVGTPEDKTSNYTLVGSAITENPQELAAFVTQARRAVGGEVAQLAWPGSTAPDLGAKWDAVSGDFLPFADDPMSINLLIDHVGKILAEAGNLAQLLDATRLPEELRIGPDAEGRFVAPCGLGVDARQHLVVGAPCVQLAGEERERCQRTQTGRCALLGGRAPKSSKSGKKPLS